MLGLQAVENISGSAPFDPLLKMQFFIYIYSFWQRQAQQLIVLSD